MVEVACKFYAPSRIVQLLQLASPRFDSQNFTHVHSSHSHIALAECDCKQPEIVLEAPLIELLNVFCEYDVAMLDLVDFETRA